MTMKNSLARVALRTVAAAAALVAFSANAAVDVLDFSGLQNNEAVLSYYSGGTGSLGSTGGPNYGIVFGSDTIACGSQLQGGSCNTAEIPGGPGAKIVYFLTGPGDVMNVAGGFDTGFSFFYSATGFTGAVTVYDGLNGTGNVLATLNLSLTPAAGDPGCQGESYCPFEAAGVTFAGTARSVNFSGTANYIGFADITIGSSSAGGLPAVPEPANIGLMMAGLAVVAGVARRRSAR